MPTYNTPKRGVAFKMYVGLVDQSNTKLLKANPTIASGDFQISKDGGSFTNLTTLPSANPASGRAVMIDLSASEMTADNIVIQCVDAAGAEWCDQLINLQTTASQLDDLATAANLATLTGYVDTEVAAIKAKTDNLPASPAATSDIPAASAIADAVWDEVLSGHATSGTTGEALSSASSGGGGGLDAAGVRAAIGLASANLDTQLSTIDTVADAIKAKTDNLPASPAATSDILNAAAIRAAVGLASANLDTQLADLPTAAENADAIWDEAVDGSTTARESMRLQNSALGGKATGMGTTTAVFRDLADTKARITATVDTDGNRSVVNRDLT